MEQMNRIWDLCKLLHNEKKLQLIGIICAAGRDGVTVKAMVPMMADSGLRNSGISQYLKQLANLGLVRRERKGKQVFYFYDTYRARDEVREVMEMIRVRLADGGDRRFVETFRTLMNPFRAKIAHYLQSGGDGKAGNLCRVFGCEMVQLMMGLELGVRDGVFSHDSQSYALRPQDDAIVRRIIELADFKPLA